MAKKNNKNTKKKVEEKRIVEQEDKGFDIHNKLFTVFCILMFFLAFYVLALYITNKNKKKSDDNTSSKETTVNYTEIMLGSSLTMKDGEYLVIYYDSKNEEISTDLNELVTNYRAGHGTTLYFVDMASAFLKEAGAKRILPLKVSGPFHTKLMKPAGDKLAQEFKSVDFKAEKTKVIFNCLGREKNQDEEVANLLEKQVQSSVYLEDSIRYMAEAGVDTFVEIGPGKAISKFITKTVDNAKVYSIDSVEDFENIVKELGA